VKLFTSVVAGSDLVTCIREMLSLDSLASDDQRVRYMITVEHGCEVGGTSGECGVVAPPNTGRFCGENADCKCLLETGNPTSHDHCIYDGRVPSVVDKDLMFEDKDLLVNWSSGSSRTRTFLSFLGNRFKISYYSSAFSSNLMPLILKVGGQNIGSRVSNV